MTTRSTLLVLNAEESLAISFILSLNLSALLSVSSKKTATSTSLSGPSVPSAWEPKRYPSMTLSSSSRSLVSISVFILVTAVLLRKCVDYSLDDIFSLVLYFYLMHPTRGRKIVHLRIAFFPSVSTDCLRYLHTPAPPSVDQDGSDPWRRLSQVEPVKSHNTSLVADGLPLISAGPERFSSLALTRVSIGCTSRLLFPGTDNRTIYVATTAVLFASFPLDNILNFGRFIHLVNLHAQIFKSLKHMIAHN